MKRQIALIVLLVLAASPHAARAAADEDYREADKNWHKGPVRWLLDRDEEKAYKKLRTDEERAAWVKEFWARRDPTPDTPANEYEQIFWERVEQADKSFKSITKSGSLTDMGRVFLMLGPPADTKQDSRYNYWIYEPDEVTGIADHLELRFAGQPTGPLLLDRKPFEEYTEAHPETRGIGWKIPAALQAPGDDLMLADAEEQEEDLSPESQRQIPILKGVLDRGHGPTDVPFDVRFEQFATAGQTTLLVITIETPSQAAHGSGEIGLLPYARLQPLSEDGNEVNITGDQPFVHAPAGDHPPDRFIYQARRNVRPGAYRAVVVVEDRVVPGTLGSDVRNLTITDFADRSFAASSISLLSKIQRLDQAEGRQAGPFVFGSYRLIPRATPVLGRNDVLAFYYQVYNPAVDSTSGQPKLEVTYTFFERTQGGWKPFRMPLKKAVGQVELYEIDVKTLLRPDHALPAAFRMEVALADRTSGQELRRELQFTVQ